jgi:hypothetical protein
MQLLSDTIRTEALNVSTTKFVYANTPANSMLRLFIAEYITHANPLDPRFTKSLAIDRQRAYRTEWVNLVAKGGDFMRDVAELGLHNKNEKQAPWRSENLYKFLEKEPDRSPASWNRGKVSVNSNRQEAPERRQHVGEQRGMKRTSGAEEQLATKKQKESDDRTPTKQKESKDQTPTRQSDQLPTRQNAQTSNRQYWQTLVRQHGQTPTRQTNQTPPRERTQTPTRHNQSPYTPPFRVPHTAADVTDTNSLTDDDTPLRVRRAGL